MSVVFLQLHLKRPKNNYCLWRLDTVENATLILHQVRYVTRQTTSIKMMILVLLVIFLTSLVGRTSHLFYKLTRDSLHFLFVVLWWFDCAFVSIATKKFQRWQDLVESLQNSCCVSTDVNRGKKKQTLQNSLDLNRSHSQEKLNDPLAWDAKHPGHPLGCVPIILL